MGVLHDVSNHWTRGSLPQVILDLLEEYQNVQSFLILNKIDKIRSKRSLLDLVKVLTCNNISLNKRNKPVKEKSLEVPVEDPNKEREKKEVVHGWPNFKAVFMVSSLTGDGVEEVGRFIESQAEIKPWEFKNNEVTNKDYKQVVEEFVRARLLDYLQQEIPYQLKPMVEYFSDENNKIFASVIVSCPSKRIENLVCGAGDGKLRQITDRVTSDLIEFFQLPVSLTLTTTVALMHKS